MASITSRNAFKEIVALWYPRFGATISAVVKRYENPYALDKTHNVYTQKIQNLIILSL